MLRNGSLESRPIPLFFCKGFLGLSGQQDFQQSSPVKLKFS
jgi:hypothetical protein